MQFCANQFLSTFGGVEQAANRAIDRQPINFEDRLATSLNWEIEFSGFKFATHYLKVMFPISRQNKS